MNKTIYISFKTTLKKSFNSNLHMYKQFHIFFQIILYKRFLVVKTQGLFCNEFIFCKNVNFQKEVDAVLVFIDDSLQI